MSFQQDITRIALENYSTDAFQYKAVVNTPGGCILSADTGERVTGIIQNKPKSGGGTTVRYTGPSDMVAGAGITEAAEVMATDSGYMVTATSGYYVLGSALTAASSGEQFKGLITHAGFNGDL